METNLIYDMYVPTRLMFGAGVLNQLNEQPMPGKRALIVISNGKSTRANGYLARTEEQLRKAGVETTIFDGVAPNPTVSNVNAGAEAARKNGCDFLVALGGGSVMDCTKAIAVMETYCRKASAHHRHHDNGRNRVRNRQLGCHYQRRHA